MLKEPGPAEAPVSLTSGQAVGATRGSGALALPGLRSFNPPAWLRRPRVRVSAARGRQALLSLILATVVVVCVAASEPTVLAPRSTMAFPGWQAGPLSAILPGLISSATGVGIGYSVLLLAMFVAYLVALAAVRTFSTRMIVTCVIALHVILLLGPPLQLNDVFNYIGYAHLGALHALNPYKHVIGQESFDPVYRFASWDNLRSPYGPLFTALTYPLAFVSLPVAFWIYKVTCVLLSLGFIALVWACARQLGRDPRYAVVLVALNPIYLMYAVGGFHNDFFMLVPMLAAVWLLLAGRDRRAGAVLMLAVAVKFTAVLLLPFLIVAAVTRPRRIRVVVGAVLGAIPLVALSLALFGLSIPNLSDQSSLLTDFSIPNLAGLLAGAGGGSSLVLRVAAVAAVLVVAQQLYRRQNWLAGAGWSTVALMASLSWLMPWYVIWVLPLAALAGDQRLRRVALGITVFLILSFMPATNLFMQSSGFNPLGGSAGQASASNQNKLEQ